MAKKRKSQNPITHVTHDSYQNFIAHVGMGTGNLHDGSTYQTNFITRFQQKLDQLYRSEWLIGEIVDAVADDMTRKGVTITSKLEPDIESLLNSAFVDLNIMKSINQCLKFARLYGGSIGIIAIDGADLSTPLQIDRIEKGAFRGIIPVDRWHAIPSTELISDFGVNFGKPAYYTLNNIDGFRFNQKVHHSRIIRFEGITLTQEQRRIENGWSMSVVERVLDTLMRFDSSSVGTSQLIYKAHLRTYKVDKLREVIAMGGEAYHGLLKQLEAIRLFQSNEGLTLMDAKDEFQTHSYSFGGLSDVLAQMSLQVSGAAQIPIVRLFEQSPAGFNSGDSDLRNYYDRIETRRANDLKQPIKIIFEILYVSLFGKTLPDDFLFEFESLWQLSGTDKANILTNVIGAIRDCYNDGLLTRKQALIEIKQFANETGLGSSISDEDIENAEENIPRAYELESSEQDNSAISKDITKDSAGSRQNSSNYLRWFGRIFKKIT